MDRVPRKHHGFLLRLPTSVREIATQFAQEDGTSLNHFITLAVAEKNSRLSLSAESQMADSRRPNNVSRSMAPVKFN
jgi:hypothetical protein